MILSFRHDFHERKFRVSVRRVIIPEIMANAGAGISGGMEMRKTRRLAEEEDGKAYCLCCLVWEHDGGWSIGVVCVLARHGARSATTMKGPGDTPRLSRSDVVW